ncbi:hypothetical protein ACQPZ2_30130 [Nocardia pseudovaccinii]|uniref:hypothetical protein n=1 Tax=Nocardia pseudovaccinii TaxID=189540 RepID=UPI003D94B5EF
MGTDLHPYTVRLRADPHYAPHLADDAGTVDSALVAGYHAAFAVPPRPATAVGLFGGLDLTGTGPPAVMALVRVEHASQVVTVNDDRTSRTLWETSTFGRRRTGLSWYLAPTELGPGGRRVIAEGHWAASGRQAVLPRSVTALVPGAPIVIDVHDHDPRIGRRWMSA